MKQAASFSPKLGFGLMRLPMSAGVQLDMEQVKAMVDHFVKAGYRYFDTAWAYLYGASEVAVRDALTQRYARAALEIADKFPVWASESEEDIRPIFDTQLSRTGAGYFDRYLAHALDHESAQKMEAQNIWRFFARMKDKGLIRKIGFSFHDSADVLKRILDRHPEVEFVQLQINYADWESSVVQSHLCYEACAERKLPVVAMEPIKGGLLASLPDAANAALRKARPNLPPAAWALRYAATLPGVEMVLSGMSTFAQLEENVRLFSNFAPITRTEQAALDRAAEALSATEVTGCTGCGYCLEGCPKSIGIPSIMDALNASMVYGINPSVNSLYHFATLESGPDDCIACGACEKACPQHLKITQWLRQSAEVFA